jgi:hypothetical protein
MGRELVWLENETFAAWGCDACGWIVPGWRVFGQPPVAVKEAFEEHDCAKFPRLLPRKGLAKKSAKEHPRRAPR